MLRLDVILVPSVMVISLFRTGVAISLSNATTILNSSRHSDVLRSGSYGSFTLYGTGIVSLDILQQSLYAPGIVGLEEEVGFRPSLMAVGRDLLLSDGSRHITGTVEEFQNSPQVINLTVNGYNESIVSVSAQPFSSANDIAAFAMDSGVVCLRYKLLHQDISKCYSDIRFESMSAILSKSLYTINKDRDKLCYLWTYDWSGPVLVPIYATEVDTHQIIGDMIAVEATLTPSLYILTQHRLYSAQFGTYPMVESWRTVSRNSIGYSNLQFAVTPDNLGLYRTVYGPPRSVALMYADILPRGDRDCPDGSSRLLRRCLWRVYGVTSLTEASRRCHQGNGPILEIHSVQELVLFTDTVLEEYNGTMATFIKFNAGNSSNLSRTSNGCMSIINTAGRHVLLSTNDSQPCAAAGQAFCVSYQSNDPQTPTDHPNTTTEVPAPPHSTSAADQSTYTTARLMPSSTLLSRSSAWTPELSSPDDMTLPSSNGRTASWTLTSTLSRSTAVDYTNQSTLTPSHQTTIHDCDTSNNHTICANYQREDNSTSGGSTTASTGDGEDEARFTLMISSTATGSDNSYSTASITPSNWVDNSQTHKQTSRWTLTQAHDVIATVTPASASVDVANRQPQYSKLAVCMSIEYFLDSSDVSPSVFTQAADGEGSTSRRLFRCSRCAQVEAGAQCDGSLVLRCISLPETLCNGRSSPEPGLTLAISLQEQTPSAIPAAQTITTRATLPGTSIPHTYQVCEYSDHVPVNDTLGTTIGISFVAAVSTLVVLSAVVLDCIGPKKFFSHEEKKRQNKVEPLPDVTPIDQIDHSNCVDSLRDIELDGRLEREADLELMNVSECDLEEFPTNQQNQPPIQKSKSLETAADKEKLANASLEQSMSSTNGMQGTGNRQSNPSLPRERDMKAFQFENGTNTKHRMVRRMGIKQYSSYLRFGMALKRKRIYLTD